MNGLISLSERTQNLYSKNNEILVSIAVATFNHENYIREALDSFLMQKTNFNVEIIVNDDASTDKTAQIVKEYKDKYPHLFNTYFQKENQYSLGRKPWFDVLFPNSNGKYIALCEGDDYWIDSLKLQKQVDFLESNNDFIATTANTYYLRNGETKFSYIESKELWLGKKMKNEIKYEDIPARLFPHTTSIMFRNKRINFHNVMNGFPIGDMPLLMLLAHSGRINYIDEIHSVYRIHDSGAISNMKKKDPLLNLIEYVKMYISINTICENKYDYITENAIYEDHYRLLKSNPNFVLFKKVADQLNSIKIEYNFKFNSFLKIRLFISTIYFSILHKLKKIKAKILKNV
jgi:glycosyltransferase involved in cell wall biosynthesis